MGAYVQAIQDFLKGKKTYLTAIIAILTALVAWSEGGLSITQLVTAIFVALQTMFIRAGVSKGTDTPAYKQVKKNPENLGPRR